MNLKQLITNAQRDEDYAALDVYNKILQTSETYKISIQQSIDKLLRKEKRHFIVNLLKTCKIVLRQNASFVNFTEVEQTKKIKDNNENRDIDTFDKSIQPVVEQKKSTKRQKPQKQQEINAETLENTQKSQE